MPFNLLILACLAYVAFLFAVAFLADRRAEAGTLPWLRSPMVYTLSLSVYCTAWTFYGAVGYAARSGLEFLTIYLGPTLVFVGWWVILRKLVRIAKAQRITSIADLISSRYGKSSLLGVVVTAICVTGATPYIALQLQSVALSFSVFASDTPDGWHLPDRDTTALWVAAGLALFTVLFGTRNLDANEQHHGVVMAIAVEAAVKLVALVAVGVFVVWIVADGPADIVTRIDNSPIAGWQMVPGRWAGLIFLSAAAILTLPRMFQVLVVENADERHLTTASWAFPLYLAAMSLFVVPIAVVGLDILPEGSNPDLFVLTLPLALDQGGLAMLAFLGGFSSATSMVIVAAIALATMVSNHVVMPLILAFGERKGKEPGDLRRVVLLARRLSIAGVMALGYGYYTLTGGSGALAATGLIAFVGVAQILPAMLGAMFWRGATRTGALLGLCAGYGLWLYTLYLPSFGQGGVIPVQVFVEGPWGIGWLRPEALFGIDGMDPLLHAMFWSLAMNTLLFGLGSLLTFPSPMERLQGARFVQAFDQSGPASSWARGQAEAEDLLVMAQRIMGEDVALAYFQTHARVQGKDGYLPDITPDFMNDLERRLSGSIGAAAAHAMIAQIAGGAAVSVEDLMAVANETAQMMEYSARLEAQQDELTRTARQLREANEKLTQLSVQKDAFLSQISHELRTPMTSIRAFSEIMMDDDVPPDLNARYARIIHDEAIRLTRLLDDLLDLSVLESGTVQLSLRSASLHDMLDRALHAAGSTRPERAFTIQRDPQSEQITVTSDIDRLTQVFINVISNSRKYCDAGAPVLRIAVRRKGAQIRVDFIDNGSGIAKGSQALIFEKFARLTDSAQAGGAGLGLAICREIMQNLDGDISYVPGQGGAAFRVAFPMVLVLPENRRT
ncbi:Na+/proline symporter [Gemmobacter megaterium]|uniref:histidine kinase n=1 Tax=Gemmobacter megaterium TaxID=1086013 RepID=A0A1N7JZE2_9RHOB|nr:ATP-binding protein [Gemmobacter megaterium]GGD99700.1 sodium:solute symporter [Gemmobacter megaterium]SIS54702.1 Na+/proline symporter [Gemmobacter megaterium]